MHSAETHAESYVRGQHGKASRSNSKSTTAGNRNAQTRTALKYYECDGIENFARVCPIRLRREENTLIRREVGTAYNIRDTRVLPTQNTPT